MQNETPDKAAMRAAVEAGLRSLTAGQSVPYEDVRKWLLSWERSRSDLGHSEIAKAAC